MKLTRDLLELAKGMKNLKVFHHISTAYTNCEYMTEGEGVEEKIYKPKMNWRLLIKAVETMSNESLSLLEAKLCGESPNPYVLTKNLAEVIVGEYSAVLPAVITRPAIVISSFNEPAPGWMQNLNGPGGALQATSKGVLRAFPAAKCPHAYEPVDCVVNGICCVTWYVGTGQCSDIGQVYTNKTIEATPELVQKYEKYAYEDHPSYRPLWYPFTYHVSFRVQYYILNLILHLFPALFIDGFLLLAGKKPMLFTTYRKLFYALGVLQPFMQNEQRFQSSKFEAIMQIVPDKEKEVFMYWFDPEYAVPYFSKSVAIGYRIFAKEPPVSEWDKKYIKILKNVHIITKYLLWGLFFWLLPYDCIYSVGLAVFEYFAHFFDISRFK